MAQILFNLAAAFARCLAAPCALSDAERWRIDPLSHPLLARMSVSELGDLPIGHPSLPKRLLESGC